MLNEFLNQIKKEQLFDRQQKILLAVSGGVDSVVMTRLFKELSFNFAVAHCNFMLRGVESDKDEDFTRSLAKESGVEFFSIAFDTKRYALLKKISIQMAARELRYKWLEEIRGNHGFDYIATAHHKDDQAETILMNVIRGTGLAGLQGMKLKNGYLIRPLLNFGREQMLKFCQERGLKYREDSSNLDEKYIRNRIRHSVMPSLREINPSADDSLVKLAFNSENASKLLTFLLDRELDKIIEGNKQSVRLNIKKLTQYPGFRYILYEVLKPYSFQSPVIEEIANSLDAQPGKIFLSPTHQCLKDRDHLIISPIETEAKKEVFTIDSHDELLDTGNGTLTFSIAEKSAVDIFKSKPDEIYLDLEKLDYPLILRHPQDGDFFFPHGMSGKKKISDYLTDKKIPLTEKRKIWLLFSGDKVVWVVGLRPDDRFRVTASTKNILKVKFVS